MLDYIIPLPPGTMSGGKRADGLMACPNNCGEVAVVRINKNREIAAYCDGRVRVTSCSGRQFSGKFRVFPERDKETAFARALDLGLAEAPREYIDLFEKSWGAKLTNSKALNYETNDPENSENPAENSERNETSDTEFPTGKTGTNPDNPTGEPGRPAISGQPATGGPATSGLRRPNAGEIFEKMYSGE